MRLGYATVFLATLCACGKAPIAPVPTAPGVSPVAAPHPAGADRATPAEAVLASLKMKSVPLPGVTGPVTVDYLVCDRRQARVWVPVGETGSAEVFDIATSAFSHVGGFKTAEREARGRKRMMGPSAATVGDGFVYVGNRATSEVCAIDQKTLQRASCLTLPVPIDGVTYVAAAKEVWVTTPRDRSVAVLDASKPDALKPKAVIKTEGEPEGYAVDATRGLFYTNLEDKDRTLVIDIQSHSIKATWNPGCGPDGPRGIAIDGTRNFVFVACTDNLRVLDAGHDGAALGKLDTGAGVDNIEYLESTQLLYVAAGKAARLTVARIDDKGQPSVVAISTTAEGARNAVVDASGTAYLVDPKAARLLIVEAPPPR